MDFLNNYSSQIKGVMRIVFGLLFLEHGLNKMIGFPAAAGATHHAFNLMSFPVGPAGVIEVVGGALILLGAAWWIWRHLRHLKQDGSHS